MARRSARGMRNKGRRRRAGRRASGIHWNRLGRFVLLAVMGLVILGYVGPVTNYWSQRQVVSEQQKRMRSLANENRLLRKRAKALTEPRLLELHARRLGMVKRGERSYVIRDKRPDRH